MSFNRRSILGAAFAVPAAVAVANIATASPAAAAGGVEAGDWADLVLEPGVTAQVGATPQVRLVTIAGTTFLQARGVITGSFAADTKVATLPATMARPTSYIRATAPRNNSQGINACRFEVNTAGSVTVFGANSGNTITWVQFDSVQTIWR
ncbi:hypothetical protein A8W25_23405 [Streptomyces sp. ERV7]|uniref:hypothetical protein n=1 Tax=Streptomyces sp. ERV7 TaxID=1322334 RepID=UPI0007F51D2E|nr:hypothetical protein [Streptomyces sp. ERV7]OAR22568.1 hypothetical protein A8W25_23405 [Streptomyces sp. ERV7]